MLDFGWQEFLVVAVVTVLVVGPKELPRVFRTITGFMRKARSLAGEFHSAMDEMAKDADLQDLKKQAQGLKDGSSDWIKEIDPTGEVDQSVKDMKNEVEATRTAVNKAGRADTSSTASTNAASTAAATAAESLSSPSPTTPAPVVNEDEPAPKKATPRKAAAKKATSKKSTAKKAAKKATAKKAAAKKTSAKKSSAKKAAAKSKPAAAPSDSPQETQV